MSKWAQVRPLGAPPQITPAAAHIVYSLAARTGYKQAVEPAQSTRDGPYSVGLRLDADTPGANGYVEQVLISREGIEMVFACTLSGKAPQALDNSSTHNFQSDVNYALFVRPSTSSSVGAAPIDSW